MKFSLAVVLRKIPHLRNSYFINCGRSCIPSSSKVFNRSLIHRDVRERTKLQTKFNGLKWFQNNCSNSKAVEREIKSRTTNCWDFYKLESRPLGFWRRCASQSILRTNCDRFFRNFSSSRKSFEQKNKTTAIYIIALVTVVLGGSYAAVPLYRIFCQASGLGGTVQQTDAGEKIKNMTAKKERLITVRFNADKSATMQWSFKPQQSEVKVYPGETALAFYTAKNPTEVPITGISTYNVIPFEAGQYFNKIQCFCFEEQRLNPHEQVDMPVFFYIDPEFVEDPALYKVDTITLSYTFFQAKEAQDLGIQ